MKKSLIVVALPCLITAVSAFGSTQSSHAQPIQSRFSRPVAQQPLTQDTQAPTVAPSSSITPGASVGASSTLPVHYGIVRSNTGGMLDVRMLDGSSKQMPIPQEMAAKANGLERGSIVGFDMDETGKLVSFAPAETDREFKGTVSEIQGDQITLVSATGESMTTSLDTATIARMGLVPGKALKVTTYKDTWATKICCDETPPPVRDITPTFVPPPMPRGGGYTPPPPDKIRGLW